MFCTYSAADPEPHYFWPSGTFDSTFELNNSTFEINNI